MTEWNKNFSNLKEGWKVSLWVGMWLYLFVTAYQNLDCFGKGNLYYLLKGIFWTLPLLAVMIEQCDVKNRVLCFGCVVLLRDVLYWLGIAIWQHGFTREPEPLSKMTIFATGMFTIIVLEVFFYFFITQKKHPWILIFTLPFILSISIGLIHMWEFILFRG